MKGIDKELLQNHVKEMLWLEIFKILCVSSDSEPLESCLEKTTQVYKYMREIKE